MPPCRRLRQSFAYELLKKANSEESQVPMAVEHIGEEGLAESTRDVRTG